MNKMLTAAVAAVAGLAMPAHATVFSFYYSGVSPDSAGNMTPVTYSGNFTTSDNAVTVDSRDAFVITAANATRNGQMLTLLAPLSFPMNGGTNDNYFFLDEAHFTGSGVSFSLPDGSYANLYYYSDTAAGVATYADFTANDADGSDMPRDSAGTFQVREGLDPIVPTDPAPVADPPVTDDPSAVPESATWAMMIAGFGMIGAGLRRQRVAVRFA